MTLFVIIKFDNVISLEQIEEGFDHVIAKEEQTFIKELSKVEDWVISNENQLTLHFTSDATINGGGFIAYFEAI